MEKRKPIKRHKSLQPLSRDHHHGLLLCWKIRQGFKRNVDTDRIKSYVDWFWKDHLSSHFREEESLLFPILGKEHDLVKKAFTEHIRLKHLFLGEEDISLALSLIEKELESHIRFEERVLFNEIQAVANKEQFKVLDQHLNQETYCENWEDKFWE